MLLCRTARCWPRCGSAEPVTSSARRWRRRYPRDARAHPAGRASGQFSVSRPSAGLGWRWRCSWIERRLASLLAWLQFGDVKNLLLVARAGTSDFRRR